MNFFDALTRGQTVSPLTSRGFDISLQDAYQIQQRMIARRIENGESVIGKKIGVTSKVVQDMLNVHQPDFGWLLSGMMYNEGEAIPANSLIQPRAEGELAFLLKDDLKGLVLLSHKF